MAVSARSRFARLARIEERLAQRGAGAAVAAILERRRPAATADAKTIAAFAHRPESLEQTLARVVELQRTEFGRRLLCGRVRTGSLPMTTEVQDRLRATGAGWLIEFATRWTASQAAAETGGAAFLRPSEVVR